MTAAQLAGIKSGGETYYLRYSDEGLVLPVQGVWYSRAAAGGQYDARLERIVPAWEPADEWQYEATLPGLARVQPDRDYLFGAAPNAENSDLLMLVKVLKYTESLRHVKALQLAWSKKIDSTGLSCATEFPLLQSLEVDTAGVSPEGLCELQGLLELRSLVLHRCFKLDDSGLAVLATLRQLNSLTLWGCESITDGGMNHLHSMASSLESLALWGCPKFSDAGLSKLLWLDRLRSVTIYQCPHVTVSGLLALKALGKLRQLNVYRCCQVGSPDLIELQEVMPKCKITIISASDRETNDFRRFQNLESYQERLRAKRKVAPKQVSAVPKVVNAAHNVGVTTVAEPPTPQRKNWWEIWK
jgi:hypothetical protein